MGFTFKHYPNASVIEGLEQRAGHAQEIPRAIQLDQSQQQIDASNRRAEQQNQQFQQKLMAERFAQERDMQFRRQQAELGRDANIAAADKAHQNRLDIQAKGFEHDDAVRQHADAVRQEGFKREDDLTALEGMRTQAAGIDSSAYDTGDVGANGSSRDQAQRIKDKMNQILNDGSGVKPATKLKLLADEYKKLEALKKATLTPSQQFNMSGQTPSAENLRAAGIQISESPYGRPGDQYEYVQNDDGSGGHWRATKETQREHAELRKQDEATKATARKEKNASRDAYEKGLTEMRDAEDNQLYSAKTAGDLARQKYGTEYYNSEQKDADDKKVQDLAESKNPRDRMAAARAKLAASTLMNKQIDAGYYSSIRKNVQEVLEKEDGGHGDLTAPTQKFLKDEYGITALNFHAKKGDIIGKLTDRVEGYRRGNTRSDNHAAAFIEKYQQSENIRARFAKAHQDEEGKGPERISDQRKIIEEWLGNQMRYHDAVVETFEGAGDAGEDLYKVNDEMLTFDELLQRKIEWNAENE